MQLTISILLGIATLLIIYLIFFNKSAIKKEESEVTFPVEEKLPEVVAPYKVETPVETVVEPIVAVVKIKKPRKPRVATAIKKTK